MWGIAILDKGITNSFERQYAENLYEYDLIRGLPDTDLGKEFKQDHGNSVALSALAINPALRFVDLRVAIAVKEGAPKNEIDENEDKIDPKAEAEAFNRLFALLTERPDIGLGAINLSWGGSNSIPPEITARIADFAKLGIFSIAASGNNGETNWFENPDYPANLDNVIAVGSHNGNGIPTFWSRNSRKIIVLADGEDFPVGIASGTSFAAPQVTATVATVQAYASAVLKHRLTFDQIVDVLQQGGNGPLSAPDPADGKTRYFLHDHAGSMKYLVEKYLNRLFDPYSYLASNPELVAAIGLNAAAATEHFMQYGALEGRTLSFDGWSYLASYADLQKSLGKSDSAGQAAALHYLQSGKAEGRSITFDIYSYLAANNDVLASLGTNPSKAAKHYVTLGKGEGRSTSFNALNYIASYSELIVSFGTDAVAATRHYVETGYWEGRRSTFDPLAYLAANPDLIASLGTDLSAAARHYIQFGHDRRPTTFDALGYLASNPTLINTIGTDIAAAERHYISIGYNAGLKTTGFSARNYLIANDDLFAAFGGDLTAATAHYIDLGWRERRATSVAPAALSTLEGNGDFADTTATAGRLVAGANVTGSFNTRTGKDHDWYRIKLFAGQTVSITLTELPLDGRSAATPTLALMDAQGGLVLTGTSSATANNATLSFTPSSSGYYFVDAAGSFNPSSNLGAAAAQPYVLGMTAT